MDGLIIGIDPGKQGAIAEYIENSMFLSVLPYTKDDKLDVHAIYKLINKRPSLIVIEKPFMPFADKNRGVTRQFTDYGQLLALCRLCCDNVVATQAVTWKKHFNLGSDKANALKKAKELFPKQTFLRTERSRVPDHNMAEAALMAHYGQAHLLPKIALS